MASDIGPQHSLLDELDARQNDVLAQLEALNSQIESLLHEYSKPREPSDIASAAGERAA